MAKRREVTLVPGDAEVIDAPASSSRLDHITRSITKKPVTVATLAQDVEDLKAQIAIMVEWLEAQGERLDSLDDSPSSGG